MPNPDAPCSKPVNETQVKVVVLCTCTTCILISTVQWLTLLSRLFGSAPRDFKVKSNELWTSLAVDDPCVTMAVSSFNAAFITSGGFPGFRHEYNNFMWPCRTRCTIDTPSLLASWLFSAVYSKMLSKISIHVWIYIENGLNIMIL